MRVLAYHLVSMQPPDVILDGQPAQARAGDLGDRRDECALMSSSA
jgi:hypothetical protein